MAKANDTNNTDWIFLREALDLAVAAFGSRVLAEKRLRQWMTAGELPWICMDWEGLDDEGLAELRRRLAASIEMLFAPSAAYYNGDPLFWDADNLKINWEESSARESGPMTADGAQALGIKVPLADLRALLPDESREGKEVHGAGEWITTEAKRMKKDSEIPPGITITDLARLLGRRMQEAAATNKSLHPIKWRSIKNKLPEWGLWPIDSIK